MLTKIIMRFPTYSRLFLLNVRCCSFSTSTAANAEAKVEVCPPKTQVEERLLRVAVIGMPNAGKSTFINNLMDRKVCATSSKVHTTRKKSQAIFTEENTQIVFVDTPGVVNEKEMKRFNLEKNFTKDSKYTLRHADVVGVIHDVSNLHERERLDVKIINLLNDHSKKPSFLVLNKIDMLKSKRKLLDITRLLTEGHINGKLMPNCKPLNKEESCNKGWPKFQDIFMVSALTGNGLNDLRDYLVSKAKPGNWLYPANVWSDQSPEEIIVNTVRGKFLDYLQQEIPYNLKIEMELFDINDQGVIKTVVLVTCPTARIQKLISGANDGRLRQIIECTQKDLQHTFQNFVRINIVLQTLEK